VPPAAASKIALLDYFARLHDPHQRAKVVVSLPEIMLLVLRTTIAGHADLIGAGANGLAPAAQPLGAAKSGTGQSPGSTARCRPFVSRSRMTSRRPVSGNAELWFLPDPIPCVPGQAEHGEARAGVLTVSVLARPLPPLSRRRRSRHPGSIRAGKGPGSRGVPPLGRGNGCGCCRTTPPPLCAPSRSRRSCPASAPCPPQFPCRGQTRRV
jgi:hypothetical protein